MSKQTSRPSGKNQGSDVLQTLLNDQAEARLQKEISISRHEAGPLLKKSSDSPSETSGNEGQGPAGKVDVFPQSRSSAIRNHPSMRETKAQLIDRMEKLLSELDRLEAGLEQKDLEKERIERDKNGLISELDKARNEKIVFEQELGRKEDAHAAILAKHQELEKDNHALKKKNQDLSIELQKNERSISDMESEKQKLLSGIHEMELKIKELASMEDDLKKLLSERDKQIDLLNHEAQRLNEENEKMKKEAFVRKKDEEVRKKEMVAVDWRMKADSLWDGTGYTAPQKALQYLNAALEIKPDWAEAINDRGLACLDDYQLDRSLDDFTAAIALKRDFAEAYHNRGTALLMAGKRFAAEKDFRIAASHGLWLGMNALSAPSRNPGFLKRIKKLLGKGEND